MRVRIKRFLVISLLAALAWLAVLVKRTEHPEEDMDIWLGVGEERHAFETADGAVLRVRRYGRPGATPVIMAHGFIANGTEFDVPRRGHNLARYVYDQGYDVWVVNYRGCGWEPARSEVPHWKHAIDEIAIYDVDALIKGISEHTGKKPIWVGHSMGGITLYMYLQGTYFKDGAGPSRVASDPSLAAERNDSLLGAVTIGSPASFRWERGDRLSWLAHSGIAMWLLRRATGLMRLLDGVKPRIDTKKYITILHSISPRLVKLLSRSAVGYLFYHSPNVGPDDGAALMRWGADNVSARMFVQGMVSIEKGDMLECEIVPGTCDDLYSYADNMHLITAPVLFISGDRDFANADGIKRYGYDKVSSEKKRFENLPGYGHTDLTMGRNVEADVYPIVAEWLEGLE